MARRSWKRPKGFFFFFRRKQGRRRSIRRNRFSNHPSINPGGGGHHRLTTYSERDKDRILPQYRTQRKIYLKKSRSTLVSIEPWYIQREREKTFTCVFVARGPSILLHYRFSSRTLRCYRSVFPWPRRRSSVCCHRSTTVSIDFAFVWQVGHFCWSSPCFGPHVCWLDHVVWQSTV